MAEQHWIESIVVGVNPQPHNVPRKLSVEYSNGLQLTFEGTVLNDLWVEFIMFRNIIVASRQGPPSVNSEEFRSAMSKVLESKTKKEE